MCEKGDRCQGYLLCPRHHRRTIDSLYVLSVRIILLISNNDEASTLSIPSRSHITRFHPGCTLSSLSFAIWYNLF